MTPTKTQIPNAATKPNPNSGHLAWYAAVVTYIKLLLIPSYHNTGFEVHRHSLALTHSLPLSHWYSDHTSPWTLDYPPIFAHFERFLSLFARLLLNPTILHLHDGLANSSPSLIVFNRLIVILADSVLIYGIHRLGKKLGSRERNLMWVLVVWNPGLLIVDHRHFFFTVADTIRVNVAAKWIRVFEEGVFMVLVPANLGTHKLWALLLAPNRDF